MFRFQCKHSSAALVAVLCVLLCIFEVVFILQIVVTSTKSENTL